MMKNLKSTLNIDVKSLSHHNLFEVYVELKKTVHHDLASSAGMELIERLRRKGFNNKRIAEILVANEYGRLKRKAIAKEWAGMMGISGKEFLELIGMKN